MKFNVVASGGTFDHFHKGHREFLRFQLSISKKILLGITTDRYVQTNKKEEHIEPFKIRKQALLSFLKKEDVKYRVELAPLDNIYIPSKWEYLPIEAIVVSKETRWGAELINQQREKEGLSLLEIIEYKTIQAEDGLEVSSLRIRNGEINREGKLYVNPDWLRSVLVLPDDIRPLLKKPFGKILQTNDLKNMSYDFSYVITVGDVTTAAFNTFSLHQKISVIDFTVERKKRFNTVQELGFSGKEKIIHIFNPSGTIHPEVFTAVKQACDSEEERNVILIQGEEDLVVIVCALVSPLGWKIFYGQPKKGIVVMPITEKIKEIMYELTGKFTRIEANNTM
ncbi:MAG: hypothetical protein A3F31_02485 [Candidatus Levybacteria bacterium RIFCSPHIGHO2_12_FULL_38_12]|nr:MAG: hypothetical protein A3D75_02100 [Candidatus Levybacteria bacterium RIFCSPHIGHO2_02_FULL_37_18]OGH22374.1 MAG: hypothetical protein A3F31_02485 [Candidatus Levybacteria bacterium RIFCSPHIGHO2_12_FULL_38_12]OGH33617.1 MAG: hypothetical protein A3A47_02190 [Candidatus Levybacteria bacterium RIFCSPLOWO2_01_FULL_37_20]OGH44298.1 MAG: hypothetical protein A3J14_03790 [Candidatus Levybacteria bacterium RIFCSPLOWO2_02_FULL_37_18]